MKRTISVVIMSLLMVALCAGIFSAAAETPTDPAQIYTPQIAANEDSSINLWFEHSFKKVMTSDTTPSGMDTYSVYMAKNEKENAQFILCSDETKTDLSATVTDFTDDAGNVIDVTLSYQAYVTLPDLDTLGFYGATAENTFIRNGEQPDPLIRFNRIKTFQLNAGKSQGFYITLETTEDTPSGWYSAQLDITDADGLVVKTATIYAYVWDFVISDTMSLQTSFYLDNQTAYGGSYSAFYEYLLGNKINAMDVPGTLNSSNPYLTDPRVTSIRVSAAGGGYKRVYADATAAYPDYAAMYDDISNMPEYEDIKHKFYFYTVDEAMSYEQQHGIYTHYLPICNACGQKSESTSACTKCGSTNLGSGSVRSLGLTVDDVNDRSNLLKSYWPDAAAVVPYHENHPYPYLYYTAPISSYDTAYVKDGLQEMIDEGSVDVWCPQLYAFTPSHLVDGYKSAGNYPRTLSGSISGAVTLGEGYFNWENVYGEVADRLISNTLVNASKGDTNDRVWAYSAGWNKSYTYCNHLIESSGLQTKMLFWQLYQNDITGYLYYGTNNWDEYDPAGIYTDYTVTGNKTSFAWRTNRHGYDTGHAIYGNGTLFYGNKQGKVTGNYVGSIRVEHIRDGIEEYEMLAMLEKLCGSKASDAIVGSVSNNVIDYLSMPSFNRSAFASELDDYDVMANVRIQLGNAIEEATANACDHKYGDGVVTKEATCLSMGIKTYTCSVCGAETTENLPTLHAVGDCFDVVVTKEATCTTEGSVTSTCTICGYDKVETILPTHTVLKDYCEKNAANGNAKYPLTPSVIVYHGSKDTLTYTLREDAPTLHSISCSVCNEAIDTKAHTLKTKYTNTCTSAGEKIEYCAYCEYSAVIETVEAKNHYIKTDAKAPTCVDEGYTMSYCNNCDYVEEKVIIPATGEHNYYEGVCKVCGGIDESYKPAYTVGDINNDGNINVQDIFRMKLIIKTLVEPTEAERAAADITGDGLVNAADTFKLSYRVLNGEWA